MYSVSFLLIALAAIAQAKDISHIRRASSTSYAAVGCYTDNVQGRALSNVNYENASSMTIERCQAICASKMAVYCGIEYGQECWYGSTLGSTKAEDSSCNMKCRGNSTQTCGGPDRLTLFKLGSASIPASTTSRMTTSLRPASSSTTKVSSTTTPSSSKTTSVTPGSTTTHPATNRGKRGIGYENTSLLKPFGNGISWAYNWASSSFGVVPAGVEVLPMLWSARDDDAVGLADWKKNAQAAINNGATALLGYNEPDLPGQADMDPVIAANLWKIYMQPFAGKAKLISPAVTNGNSCNKGRCYGIDWLLAFKAACTGCTVDAYALHWYESATNIGYFKGHISNATSLLKGNLYVTEFAPTTGSDADKGAFFSSVVPWLESQSFVERYAAFGAFDKDFGQLISGGTLNAAGSAYVGA